MPSQPPHNNPTAIIVVAHAPLASALLVLVQHVHGQVPAHVYALDVQAQETPEHTQARVAQLLQGGTALVLTDLPGGTPHNCAQKACEAHPQVQWMSPVSAPLLLRAINYSHLAVQALYDMLKAG